MNNDIHSHMREALATQQIEREPPKMAYTAVLEGPDDGREVLGFYLGLAAKDVAGYHQLKPGYGPYPTYTAAADHALEMNRKIGHTQASAADVVISTMPVL